jgi:hypothetical protein
VGIVRDRKLLLLCIQQLLDHTQVGQEGTVLEDIDLEDIVLEDIVLEGIDREGKPSRPKISTQKRNEFAC